MTTTENKFYIKYRHFNPDIEAAILGACVLEFDAFARISSLISSKHFFNQANQIVFDTLTEMFGDGEFIDLHTVVHFVYKHKLESKFPSSNAAHYIASLTSEVVTSAHLEMHAIIVRQLYATRECIRIQHEASDESVDPIEKMELIKQQLQDVLAVQGVDDWVDMSQAMLRLTKHMENVKGKELLGISSGFPTLDKILYGLQPTQLVIIGARPSVGKSALVGGIAVHAAKQKHTVGVISLEMPVEQVAARNLAIYADEDFWRIFQNRFRSDEDELNIAQSISDAATLPIFFSDQTNVSAAAIRAKCMKLKKRAGLDILIVDYLQLIEGDGKVSDNREREVSKISRALKLLAMELKIPVVLLCQLNRESEKRVNKKPKMSDLRESGAIEQDADVIMMLHRDWKSGILQDANGFSTERKASLIVEKNRNGETVEVEIAFDPDKIRFYEDGHSFMKPYIPQGGVSDEGPF